MPDFLNTLPIGREVKERFWSEDYVIPFECVREDGPSFLMLSKAVDNISADSGKNVFFEAGEMYTKDNIFPAPTQENTSLSWPEEDWLQFLNPYRIRRNNRGRPWSESPFSRNGRLRRISKCLFETGEKMAGQSILMTFEGGDNTLEDPTRNVLLQTIQPNTEGE
ncbi:hypothetical protein CHS0354_026658 [Potamilus streckersoni]|uniref:Uncharacterized protein n=1 Tax=Potamilus streckersoni TaxID=2493646 RepID=A0AAE0S811_9BIVA|nr:hypothetical protein CHS0354_026658 [Potamilus streckersoni]